MNHSINKENFRNVRISFSYSLQTISFDLFVWSSNHVSDLTCIKFMYFIKPGKTFNFVVIKYQLKEDETGTSLFYKFLLVYITVTLISKN